MTIDPYKKGPFRQVADMEVPLATIHDMLRGLALLAEGMDEDYASVVQRIAWYALDQCRAAEKLRGELFHLTHPNRDHFEKEGWPS
ncbi:MULTISPECIES: hypothetical protein [unclassified Shinella]|uniref:hypothetical protein n=1 Tax=unclassified Shinella TaxID=2643062 RepID=UPI00225D3572|nr:MULTISPECIES: hypothetical protein [unclassified Shinella]MCO5139277.1 hypothetical protein [Shinella sp.]MDC7255994.1 hypothetical protein [Shinella sp. YE25]CAI0338831.1 hypothetical protein SHINE37_42685 [Rhizobiaceae bacterium]CAK7257260.1 protein of unknown function [Shinella sp. WSC3-e]